jgi:hypothetical protein
MKCSGHFNKTLSVGTLLTLALVAAFLIWNSKSLVSLSFLSYWNPLTEMSSIKMIW